MKPILININEMSDSREVYESKPNIFFTIFIYTILGMLLIALTWMYFGKIDVVVKSEGMLRPNNQVATVINTYSGTLQEVNVKEGSSVKEGDILYIVEHGDLLTELDYYNEQLTDTVRNLNLLSEYKQSIEDGINYFTQTQDEEEYYIKYQGFELSYKLMDNDYTYRGKERELNLASVTEQLATLDTQLTNTKLLKNAVNTNKNLFVDAGSEKEYYDLFVKYQSDYASIVTKYKNESKI
ncbi:MAG: biotin/lipoyl-binding protein [Herbinix sp.]|nr:biotin/lipoyl-binding protein [Herbinix sp.]